jgi:hypothetical protein
LFDPRALIIERFVVTLDETFHRLYGNGAQGHRDTLRTTAYLALEKLAQSDCMYHDLDHTILNTAVGQDILIGKRLCGETVTAADWLHFVVTLLLFNIGYVKGVCPADRGARYATGRGDETVVLKPGATGAALGDHNCDRSQLVARLWFDDAPLIDVERLVEMIELTRFPPPRDPKYGDTDSLPGLIRAAHFIGAVADPAYMRKVKAFFLEFEEAGWIERFGFSSPLEFREGYAGFYQNALSPYMQHGLRYLSETRAGTQWIAILRSHLHAELHGEAAMGISRRVDRDTDA